MEAEEDEYEYYDPDTTLSEFWTQMGDHEPSDLPGDPVNTWLDFYVQAKDSKEEAEDMFVEYWRIVVPILLAPHNRQTTADVNRRLADANHVAELKQRLWAPLERFLAADDPAILEKLLKNNEPSSVCGRQLEYGEPVYLCRDCGADATVVLCSSCFQASEHRKHHYRMFVSEGGGFCDCGDHEAFIGPHYWCNHHLPPSKRAQSKGAEDQLDVLPKDVAARAKHLFQHICRYVLEVTSCRLKMEELSVGQKEIELFPSLKYPFQFNSHCLLLCNDSNHTYQEVSSVLKLCLSCGSKLAAELTELVDKEGRAIIVVGTFKDCAAVRDKIESRRGLGPPLKTLILPTYIVSHQLFATLLLEWLSKVLQGSPVLRASFGEMFFGGKCAMPKRKYSSGSSVDDEKGKLYYIAEIVMLNDAFVWKQVRKAWLDLVVEAVLKDYQLKLQFAKLFVRHYHSIALDFIHDDQESDASITRLTVQIFTVKSIAQKVIETEDAFYRLVCLFKDLLTEHEDEGVLKLEPWMGEEKAEFTKAETILTDLTYLLQLPTEKLSDEGRRSFTKGVDAFISLLSHLQEIDKQKRQVGLHVEFESQEWEHVGKLISSIANIVDLVHKWCALDRGLLVNAFGLIISACNKRPKLPTKEKELKFQNGGHKYTVSELNILSEPVSVHVPLQRFLAGLLPLFNNFDLNFALTLRRRTDDSLVDFLASVVDPVITAVATLSSIQVGMWKRNGTPAQAQAFIYHHANICPSLKRLDLVLLQASVGLVSDPGRLIFTILQRFKLISWAGGEPECRPGGISVLAADFVHHTNRMAERFLALILAIVCERHYQGIAKRFEFTQLDEIRHRIVHILAAADLPHSKVLDKLHLESTRSDVKASQLDALLRDVGNLRPSAKDPSKRIYELKREYERHFNPSFYFYSSEDMSKACERRMEAKRKNNDRLVAPPPSMPNLSVIFSTLPRVCATLPILRVIQMTLARATSKDHPNKLVTSQQLNHVLLLLIQGYVDDLRRHSNEFTRAAETSSLFTLLKSLHDLQHDHVSSTSHRAKVTIAEEFKTEELKELVLYALEQGNEARQLLLNIRVAPQTRAASAMQNSLKTTTSTTTTSPTSSEEAAASKKRKAEQRKHQLMAQYKRMQNRFADQHASVLQDVNVPQASTGKEEGSIAEKKYQRPVAVGPKRIRVEPKSSSFTCILCQEDVAVGGGSSSQASASQALVSACYIHKTSVFGPRKSLSDMQKSREGEDVILSTETMRGPMVTSCGHVMHAKCYHKFFDSVQDKERERQQSMYRHLLNFNAYELEFLCPICERLCNGVLPLLPSITNIEKEAEGDDGDKVGFDEWVQILCSLKDNMVINAQEEFNSEYYSGSLLVRYGIANGSSTTKGLQEQFKELQQEWSNRLPPMATEMTNSFVTNLFMKSLDCDPSDMNPKQVTQLLASLSLSLQLQVSLKQHQSSIGKALSKRDMDTLRYLTRVTLAFPMVTKTLQAQLQSLALLYIKILFGECKDSDLNFGHIDALFLLALLKVALPSLPIEKARRRTLDFHEHHIIRLCFGLHLLQTCLSFDPTHPSPAFPLPTTTEEKEEEGLIRNLMHTALKTLGRDHVLMEVQGHLNACRWVKWQMMRFVRCAALLVHFQSDVNLPEEEHFDHLCAYIGLGSGNLRAIIEEGGVKDLLNMWLKSSSGANHQFIQCPSPLRHLIALPDDYSTLMDMAASFKCPNNSKGICRFPSMCLVCGAILCAQCAYCRFNLGGKMVGACSAHSHRCGADTGLFLNLRQCQVIIHLNQKRGVICAAPYVDRNGETDLGLRRGNPMRFDPALYEDLRRIWITNDMPNTISRSFDPDIQVIRADWHTL